MLQNPITHSIALERKKVKFVTKEMYIPYGTSKISAI
jgi:hypothetical protein